MQLSHIFSSCGTNFSVGVGKVEAFIYAIITDRLIVYNHGKINEVQVESIEKNLTTIINQSAEMKRDLLFLLKENEELEG